MNVSPIVIIIISITAFACFVIIVFTILFVKKRCPSKKREYNLNSTGIGSPMQALIPPLFFTEAIDDPLAQSDLYENILIDK